MEVVTLIVVGAVLYYGKEIVAAYAFNYLLLVWQLIKLLFVVAVAGFIALMAAAFGLMTYDRVMQYTLAPLYSWGLVMFVSLGVGLLLCWGAHRIGIWRAWPRVR